MAYPLIKYSSATGSDTAPTGMVSAAIGYVNSYLASLGSQFPAPIARL
jgi:hypothetical protein